MISQFVLMQKINSAEPKLSILDGGLEKKTNNTLTTNKSVFQK